MAIAVKNPEAIEKMRRACRIVALVHKTMEQEIRPGIQPLIWTELRRK